MISNHFWSLLRKIKNMARFLAMIFAGLMLILICAAASSCEDSSEVSPLSERQKQLLANHLISVRSLPSATKLNFDYSDITSEDLAILEKTPNVQELYLNESRNIDDSVAKYLCLVPKLKLLNLTKTNVSGSISPSINCLQDLEELLVGTLAYPYPEPQDMARSTPFPLFTDDFLVHLDLPKLRKLRMGILCEISDAGLLQLCKFPHLEEAILYSPHITPEGIQQMELELEKSGRRLTYSEHNNTPSRSYRLTLRVGTIDER